MKCVNGKEVGICYSAGGFYIGVVEDNHIPYCRVSGYYKTPQEASEALEHKTFHRDCIENNFCNGGCGCQIE